MVIPLRGPSCVVEVGRFISGVGAAAAAEVVAAEVVAAADDDAGEGFGGALEDRTDNHRIRAPYWARPRRA